MAKPIIAVHLCPAKLYWELSHLANYPNLDQPWWQQPELLIESLYLLASHGITCIRLTVFNTELTKDGHLVDWTPIDVFTEIAKRLNLQIDLCLGPYQYPLYPGVRLPKPFRDEVKVSKLDEKKNICDFGRWLLTEQLKRYGKNRTIRAFYLGNEWHTTQLIEDGSKKKCAVSLRHMQSLARLCKKLTKKPMVFNTNHDVSQIKKIQHDFLPLWQILKTQAWLGLDIYPSRIVAWKTPQLWLNRQRKNLIKAVAKIHKDFSLQVIVSEFEAQPWGDGRAWALQLSKVMEPKNFTSRIFLSTIEEYQLVKLFPVVTFWSGEFLVVAHKLGHKNYLETISKL